MPLRDHFRPPFDDVHSWDELHAMWPAVMVQQLVKILPAPYFAAPGVYLGTLYEVDLATFREPQRLAPEDGNGGSRGAVATLTHAPPKPTLTFEPRLPRQDVYEIRIYDSRRNRRLAVIEIISPGNKDRPESRGAVISKTANLLANGICVSLVDVVSTSRVNLYAELMNVLSGVDPAVGAEPSPMYAATIRLKHEGLRPLSDNWYHSLAIRRTLPTLPIWLNETLAISLDLEASYEETCRTLRIQ